MNLGGMFNNKIIWEDLVRIRKNIKDFFIFIIVLYDFVNVFVLLFYVKYE